MGGVAFDKYADPSTYQKNSTMSTIFSLLNSMIGGTMLFLPLYFNTTGLLMSTIVMIVMGLVSYKGCDIYVAHLKPNEFDIQEILGRIMGRRWRMFFIVIASIYMLLAGLLYYSFSIEMLFSISTFILYESGSTSYAEKSDVTFSTFSIQYVALFTIPLFLGMLFLKDLRFLIRVAELGVYAIYSYVIFILYVFITNITSGTLAESISSDLNLWSFDVGQLASTASLAFQIQSQVCPMVKCHKFQSKNRFVIKVTYVIGTIIYLAIGIVGGLGVLGRPSIQRTPALNINDFFGVDQWQPLIVELLYLIHLVSMYPILFDIGRNRIFEIIYKETGGKPPKIVFILTNVAIILVCAIIKIVNISPNTLVDLNGAFSCFFIVFLFPSLLHLACYHGSNKFLLSVRENLSILMDKKGDDDNNISQRLNDNYEEVDHLDKHSAREGGVIHSKGLHSCNDHTEDIHSIPKTLRIAIYAGIIILGLAIFFYGMYSIIQNVIDGNA